MNLENSVLVEQLQKVNYEINLLKTDFSNLKIEAVNGLLINDSVFLEEEMQIIEQKVESIEK